MEDSERIKFIADENVGRLAKLLRLLGFDTFFFKDGDDSRIVEIALNENRIILTRDSHISERRLILNQRVKLVLIHSDRRLEQLKQVEDELGLRNKSTPFRLCLECNLPLRPIPPEAARERVPPFVFQTQKNYTECPQCGRVFWKGTHWQAMTRQLLNIDILSTGVDQ
jgi:uncharacterized protein